MICPVATVVPPTSALTSNIHRRPMVPVFRAWSNIRSSGRAAAGNFICRIAESKNFRCSEPHAPAIPAVWDSASTRITPGTIGLSGKCPRNIASADENTLTHSASPDPHTDDLVHKDERFTMRQTEQTRILHGWRLSPGRQLPWPRAPGPDPQHDSGRLEPMPGVRSLVRAERGLSDHGNVRRGRPPAR